MTRQGHNREESSHATCNWIEVRNQAAIAAMSGIIANSNPRFKVDANKLAKDVIEYADALIKQLKGE